MRKHTENISSRLYKNISLNSRHSQARYSFLATDCTDTEDSASESDQDEKIVR